MKITNDNDFLGAAIKLANEYDDCTITKLAKKYGMTTNNCLPFIKSLESQNYIAMNGSDSFHIFPQGKAAYVSPAKKKAKSVFKLSVSLLKYVVSYILGIISGLVIAYFTHKFGW